MEVERVNSLSDSPSPWRVREYRGKYYGTIVEDANGESVARIWHATGEPSERELEHCNGSIEKFREYVCDSHWECEVDLYLARAIVALRNAEASARWDWDKNDARDALLELLYSNLVTESA